MMLRRANRPQRENENHVEYLFGGHRYHVSGREVDRTYLQCAFRRTAPCPARGYVLHEDWTYHSARPHKDLPRPELLADERFVKALRRAVISDFRPIDIIYEEVAAREGGDIRQRVPFHRMRTSLQSWHREVPIIDQPRSYRAYADVLQLQANQGLLRHERGRLNLSHVRAEDGNSAVILMDSTLIGRLPQVGRLNIISFTKLRPSLENTRSMVCLIAEYNGYGFPFGWGLSSFLTKDVAVSIVRTLQQGLPGVEPTEISTNSDWRMRDAITAAWDDVPVKTTYYQHSLALLNNAARMGLNLNDGLHQTVLKKLMMVCLEPAENIIEAFDHVWHSMGPQTLEVFLPFLIWYRSTFIIGLTPENATFYRNQILLSRVELQMEGRLEIKFPNNTPEPWSFHRGILQMANESHKDLTKLLDPGAGQLRPNISMSLRLNSLIPLGSIRRLWKLLDNGRVSSARFVDFGPELLDEHFAFLVFNEGYMNGNFAVVERPAVAGEDYFTQPRAINDRNVLHQVNFDNFARPRVEDDGIPPDNLAPFQPEEDDLLLEADLELAAVLELGAEEPQGAIRYNWRCPSCEERPVTMIFSPCNCVALCTMCAAAIRDAGGQMVCTVCHEPAESLDRIYIQLRDAREDIEDPLDPYSWLCVVCEERTSSYMATRCNQLVACEHCMPLLRDQPRRDDLPQRCPACGNPTALVEVHIRQI